MEQKDRILLFTMTILNGAKFQRSFILQVHVNQKQAEILQSTGSTKVSEQAEIHALIVGSVRKNFGFAEDKGYYVLLSPYELKSISISELGLDRKI